jgi:site-specific DNA-adenine methylase
MNKLRAPFPWFGGKSRCAALVWERFGDVPNYVEPFAGSLAVLLGRPHEPRCETVNDLDCYLSNFWRAVSWQPEEVAKWSDWPVNEADLHARHKWLVKREEFRKQMRENPDFCDAKIAGWWVWGISQWIGSGWCARPEWEGRALPGRAARGIHTDEHQSRPSLTKRGRLGSRGSYSVRVDENGELKVDQRRPHLSRDQGIRREEIAVDARIPNIATNGTGGRGVLRKELQPEKRPNLHRTGRGVLSDRALEPESAPPENLPQISGDGSGNGRGVLTDRVSANLVGYMQALQARLRRVRVCCGDWQRILGPSPTTCIGLTGVFLDPPYSDAADRDTVYNNDSFDVAHDVREWAVAHGQDPKLRIALCGYEGEHPMPPDWECVAWKANGGYGNQSQGRGRNNAKRERIWFSPACLRATTQQEMFQ